MSAYVSRIVVATATILALASPLSAQDTAEPPQPLPADSMELGDRYVNWLLDYRADSLWTVFNDRMKERFVSPGDMVDQLGQIFQQIGTQQSVIDQRYWTRDGASQFWHTARFSNFPEPGVIRLVISPEGKIAGLGMNPQSQNPPVDDPDQHGGTQGYDVSGRDAGEQGGG